MEPIKSEGTIQQFVARLNAKIGDRDARFDPECPICDSCQGSGWAPIYYQGKRSTQRCPGWRFGAQIDSAGKEYQAGYCHGDPDARGRDIRNRKDLIGVIWKTGIDQDLSQEDIDAHVYSHFGDLTVNKLAVEQLELLLVYLQHGKVLSIAANAELIQLTELRTDIGALLGNAMPDIKKFNEWMIGEFNTKNLSDLNSGQLAKVRVTLQNRIARLQNKKTEVA